MIKWKFNFPCPPGGAGIARLCVTNERPEIVTWWYLTNQWTVKDTHYLLFAHCWPITALSMSADHCAVSTAHFKNFVLRCVWFILDSWIHFIEFFTCILTFNVTFKKYNDYITEYLKPKHMDCFTPMLYKTFSSLYWYK